ncbi:coiled-coil domain-containing protein 63 isoform X2 [Coturnix japonica]|uniref:Coiled-coil domain containing 63 n=1 Tax=Coturnix japonica TaxID=93934 RepID=A0A8C2SKA9_COTJA|nr:coiled-coil domain-containing protein 63 isoform X2 [Coturnix japonica]
MKGSKLRESSSLHTISDFPVTERQAQMEFYRLQKQLQIAVDRRKSSGANLRQQMKTQEKEIQSLKEEHKDVALTLGRVGSLRNMIQDHRICMELKYLLHTKDQYNCLIRDRKTLLSELDNEILQLQKKVEREEVITKKVRQANCGKWLQKQTEKLELHLNNATVRFDTTLTNNNKLQEEIENLRFQKAILDNFYSKLYKHLAQQKKRMDTAIQQTTQAQKQRTEYLARISAMNERRKQNTAQFNIEMQERERIRDQENKLKIFVLTKYTDRSEMEEQAIKKEALKAAERLKRSQGESFESREVTYRRLLELAENRNIDQLVNGFIEKEGKNFAYFSYASELNSEMEKLQQKIKNVQNEITLFTTDQENTESSSHHVLKELEEQLSQNTEAANDYEDRCKESNKVLGQLKSAIEVLFKENNCDATKIREQLGDNGQITDLNLMQYLGLVEKKTNELLLMESILLYMEAEGSVTFESFDNPLLGGTKLLRSMEPSNLHPPAPALLGTIDAADAFEVPLDHDQMRELLLPIYQKE